MIQRLERLGFQQAQIREAAIELLHEEEWAASPESEEQLAAEQSRDRETERSPEQAEAPATTAEHRPHGEGVVPPPTAPEHPQHPEHAHTEHHSVQGQ